MLKKDRILVPIDLTEGPSELALTTALQFATSPAALHVLHVVEPSGWEMPTTLVVYEGEEVTLTKYLRVSAKRDLDETIARVLGDDAERVERAVEWGHPVTTIISVLEKGGYDLAVVATRGRHGLARVLHGSVAERIVRLAPCPVLTVRAADGDKPRDAVPSLRGDAARRP